MPFQTANSVNYDTAIVALNQTSEPFGSTRHTFDADATYSPVRHVGFRAGYTREEVDRTYRIVEKTTEDIGRASVDLTGLGWMTVRGVYEHSQARRHAGRPAGTAVDRRAAVAAAVDISDRNQDRFNAIVKVTPVSQFSVNGSAGVGEQDYPGTNFGLRSTDSHFYSVGFDYVPSDHVSLGATYGYEKYTALQASRTANPLPANTLAFLLDPTQQFNDPRRDWTDNSADRARTVNASMDLIKLLPRTDVKVAYDYSADRVDLHLRAGAEHRLADPRAAHAGDQRAAARDLRRPLLPDPPLCARAGLLVRQYRVDDFALSPVASLAQPATGTPADDARVLLRALHREHGDGAHHLPLVRRQSPRLPVCLANGPTLRTVRQAFHSARNSPRPGLFPPAAAANPSCARHA